MALQFILIRMYHFAKWTFSEMEQYMKAIAYYRVSTSKQGQSGLGLEAQQATVSNYLDRAGHDLIGERTEIESGKNGDRKQLGAAIRECRLKNAVLVVAKLDRLSRDLHFITSLQKSGVRFVIAENPEMNELTIHLLAAVAQHEREMISQRTKAALAAAKARGVRLGNPRLDECRNSDTTAATTARQNAAKAYAAEITAVVDDIRIKLPNASLRKIASELNARSFATRRGCHWTAAAVRRALIRAL